MTDRLLAIQYCVCTIKINLFERQKKYENEKCKIKPKNKKTKIIKNNKNKYNKFTPNWRMCLSKSLTVNALSSRNARATTDEVSITLSPVLVGSGLTVVIISLAIIVRIFIVTFLHNLRRNQQHSSKPIATGVAAQAGDVLKCGGMEKPRWQHTDIKTKSSEDLVEDERDPDVIPSQYVTAGNSSSVGGGGSNGGSGNGSSNSGGGGGGSGSGNAGSSELHFTPIAATKWSPNSKHLPTTAYDNITQLVAANQITARTTHPLSGTTADPNGSSSSSVLVNAVDTGLLHHQQQQQQLLNTKAAGAGAGAGAATVVTATHSANGLNEALIGSPTAAYNATHHQQQQQLHGPGGGGTLPPGLGSGSGYLLSSLINSNESCNSNGSISGSNGGLHHNVVGGTIGRATMLHHHQQQQQQQQQSHHPLPVPHPLAYNTLAGTTGVNASGRHHHSGALPSMLLTSQTSASLSGIGLLLNASNNNSSSSGGASGLGLSMTGAVSASAASTATTSCNSSSDLDDNININAIKDCLMTQRVPESCV